VRTYQKTEEQVQAKKTSKRKAEVAKKDTNKPKRTRVSNEQLSRKLEEIHSSVSSFQSQINSYKKQPIELIVLPNDKRRFRVHDDDFYMPDNHYGKISSKECCQEVVVKKEKIHVISSDDDEGKKMNNTLNSSFLNGSKTEILHQTIQVLENKKEKVKVILKEIPLMVEVEQKFRPLMSEERIKFEKRKKYFETQPCTSKDAIKFDMQIKKERECIENSEFNLSLTKDDKIPGLLIGDEFNKLQCNMREINPHIKKLNHSLKTKAAFSKMATKNGLVSLFKCMAAKCSYTTMSDDNFLEHLNLHVANPYFATDFYFNCAYCGFKATGPIDMRDHLKHYHAYCRYQCNKCFYRSAEARSVFDHQQLNHVGSEASNQILECPSLVDGNYPEAKNELRMKTRCKNTLICNGKKS
jgi:hypothetical protein